MSVSQVSLSRSEAIELAALTAIRTSMQQPSSVPNQT
jgi:hypothetical protein